MIISAINRFCARHGRITYTFIGLAIIIPFVFLYGDFGGTMGSSSSAQDMRIGKMFGQPINRIDFFRQLSAVKIKFFLDYQRILDSNNDRVARLLSREVLNRMRALYYAAESNIDAISDDEVEKKILSMPVFQTTADNNEQIDHAPNHRSPHISGDYSVNPWSNGFEANPPQVNPHTPGKQALNRGLSHGAAVI